MSEIAPVGTIGNMTHLHTHTHTYVSVNTQVPGFAEDQLDTMLQLVHTLRSSQDPTVNLWTLLCKCVFYTRMYYVLVAVKCSVSTTHFEENKLARLSDLHSVHGLCTVMNWYCTKVSRGNIVVVMFTLLLAWMLLWKQRHFTVF